MDAVQRVAKMLYFAVILLLFLGSLVVVALHGLPEGYLWLANDQLADSRSFLFNGLLGGILALLTQRRIFR